MSKKLGVYGRSVRRLTLRSATGTAQRAVPTISYVNGIFPVKYAKYRKGIRTSQRSPPDFYLFACLNQSNPNTELERNGQRPLV